MYENLKFRRQFLLTRAPIKQLADWKCFQMGAYHLYAHPDLEVTEKKETSALVLLIGYIFDPFHPTKTNLEIVSDIVSRVNDFEDLVSVLKPYAGRYAIIYRDKTHSLILHDPYGVREIYYCTQPNRVICGSQPNLIDTFSEPKLGITTNQNILDFYKNDMKSVRLGRSWVGDETYFQDVKHLMPNHYLGIGSLTSNRYWPNRRLEKMDLSIAVKQSCDYLKGVLKAVTSRYDVMMAVTAGFDSRSLLAASREVRDRIYYFINKEPPLSDRSPDIRIPRDIFNKFHIPFHVHDVSGPVDEEFKKVFLNNTFFAIERSLPTIYNVYFKKFQDKINLLGIGEIGRQYFGDAPLDLDGYYLARSLKYRRSMYATTQCERWLREAKGIAETYNLDIMKLFNWENLLPNWGAVGNAESDIAIEEFDPYSSYYIMEIMLSVDQNQGGIFEGMFTEMWPELLDFPLNPPETMSDWIKQWLSRVGFFQPLKRGIYRFDRWKYRRLMRVSQQ
jgi:hypothetical protein